jgi:hypothetical protein
MFPANRTGQTLENVLQYKDFFPHIQTRMYDLIDFSLRKCVQEKIMMRTCKEVGAMRQYLQSHAQDELLKIYRREYKRRFAWIRAGKISQEAFCAWSKDAQKEKEKCKNGEIDQKEFTKWLKQ